MTLNENQNNLAVKDLGNGHMVSENNFENIGQIFLKKVSSPLFGRHGVCPCLSYIGVVGRMT